MEEALDLSSDRILNENEIFHLTCIRVVPEISPSGPPLATLHSRIVDKLNQKSVWTAVSIYVFTFVRGAWGGVVVKARRY